MTETLTSIIDLCLFHFCVRRWPSNAKVLCNPVYMIYDRTIKLTFGDPLWIIAIHYRHLMSLSEYAECCILELQILYNFWYDLYFDYFVRLIIKMKFNSFLNTTLGVWFYYGTSWRGWGDSSLWLIWKKFKVKNWINLPVGYNLRINRIFKIQNWLVSYTTKLFEISAASTI